MSRTLMHTIPFVEAHHIGKSQRPKSILLRLSETTSNSGAALGIANYWHASNSPKDSCHYIVDEGYTVSCVPNDRVAYSAKFDTKGLISINVCAFPTFDVSFWKDPDYAPVLDQAAQLTAKLVEEYKIPVRYVDLIDNRRIFTRGGIMVNVRGSWPTHTFLDRVNHYKN